VVEDWYDPGVDSNRIARNGGFESFCHLINRSNPEFIPEFPGVYIGYHKTGKGNVSLSYVGMTNNLRRRLRRHDNTSSQLFSFRVIEDERVRKAVEKELIEDRSPTENRKHADSGMRNYEWNL